MQLRLHFLTAALLSLAAARGLASVLCVDLTCPTPTPPYTNWLSAATNIQDAVAAAADGDRVLVTNGVYRTGTANGGTCRVMLSNAITLASVNGPQATAIQGGSGVRCVYAYNSGAVLDGFTLTGGSIGGVQCSSGAVVTNCIIRGNTNGAVYGGTIYNCLITQNHASDNGGGAQSATLYDCILSNNVAVGDGGGAYACALYRCLLEANHARYGGGASGGAVLNCVLAGNSATAGGGYDGGISGIISNCTVIGNSASQGGGGVGGGTAYNCLIVSNSAVSGGGLYIGNGRSYYNCTICANAATNSGGGVGMYYSGGNATLWNCIIYYNSAKSNANWESYGPSYDNFYDRCCTTPLPNQSFMCITNVPGLVDWPSGNFRLQTGSPCIDVGYDEALPMTTDLDGRLRIAGGPVDLGAYEYQGAGMGEFIGWLQQYGLPTDGSADYADADADGLSNWQEWIAGTNPTSSASALAMQAPRVTASNTVVSWQSVSNRTYFLQRCTSLAATPAFSTIGSNVAGQANTTAFTDTEAPGVGPYMYRVGVQQ
jgi:hypothetical protein